MDFERLRTLIFVRFPHKFHLTWRETPISPKISILWSLDHILYWMSNEQYGINSFLILDDDQQLVSNETPNMPIYTLYEGVSNEILPNN
jgi:hypothetical protein